LFSVTGEFCLAIDNNKYKELSFYSFSNRGEVDKLMAMSKVSYDNGAVIIKHELRADKADTGFQADYNHIFESCAYKRLEKMGQLAPSFSNIFQTRLKHTDHVVNIATKICRAMGLDEDSTNLTRAICISHDIGHAPFSHEGEEAFNEAMNEFDGRWDHDNFGIELILKYAKNNKGGKGIPITLAAVEGLVKRFKVFTDDTSALNHFNRSYKELGDDINQFKTHLSLDKRNSAEGQIASISDWVAFTASDIRDTLLMKLHSERPSEVREFFDKLSDAFPSAKAMWKEKQEEMLAKATEGNREKRKDYLALYENLLDQCCENIETLLLKDVLDNSLKNFNDNKDEMKTASDIRNAKGPMITVSDEMYKELHELHKFYEENVYSTIREKHVDTKLLMSRFMKLIHSAFETGNEMIDIEPEWKEKFNSAVNGVKGGPKEKLKKLEVVAAFITTKYTDVDVMKMIKGLDNIFYNENIANKADGIYPIELKPITNINHEGKESIRGNDILRVLNEINDRKKQPRGKLIS